MPLNTTNIFSQNLVVKKITTTTETSVDSTGKITVSTTDTIKTEPLSNAIINLPQEEKINIFNNTSYTSSANAVKLLPFITNNNGKIKLYTEINSNIKVGDKVFIMYNPTGLTFGVSGITDGIIMDNFLEFSGCTTPNNWMYLPQMQGYNVIEINDSNNEITIDRWYDSRLVNKKIYNHYIAKIYIRNIQLEGGEVDGAEILYGNFNNAIDASLDINLVQAVVLSGISFYMRFKNKYDNLYVTTNSASSITGITSSYKPYIYKGVNALNQDPTPVSSYYTNNNNTYGYNYIYYNDLRECTIDNGYYDHCNVSDCTINGGTFTNCSIFGSTINGGIFYKSPLDTNCLWFYGTWSGGTFTQDVWYNGIWNGGDFVGKDWRDGIFNNGHFSGSTWRTGLFNNGIFDGKSIWSGGTFGGGTINNSEWNGGVFNGGSMNQCNWYDGICNGGKMTNINWIKGTFNNGSFNTGTWYSGIVNNGYINNTYWSGGTFNGGTFNSQNNVLSMSGGTLDLTNNNISKYWRAGIFNGGTFSNSIWGGGTFNNGNFQDGSLWSGGTFNYGNFTNSNWIKGNFFNGTVTNSYFHDVIWHNGIWNSGALGILLNGVSPEVTWDRGTFNNGIFGIKGSTNKNQTWYGGDFYKGTFNTTFGQCYDDNLFTSFGGFSGGTFHNGYFNGVFWKGIWVNGIFEGCNKTNIITNRDVVAKPPKRIITRKFGELSIRNQQQGISNQGNSTK